MSFLVGRKTYVLAGLQAAATVAYTLGFIDATQYALIAQIFGWPMAATVAHKVARSAQP